ncbi:hypothetical protein BAOM_0398 [Peribacillus asahii]|uniref:Uncharacterized protein n=1 Tax=Peribacillus asahii TaxID=228899 RepID=A0A3Q9RK43_9BACI|nr:hypothetical protein BAOM_0398 [Peribacillus asahii]
MYDFFSNDSALVKRMYRIPVCKFPLKKTLKKTGKKDHQ